MCDIPNDIAMDGNTGETPAMDTLEAEKVVALQSEPSVEEAVQGSTVARASQAIQSPSQVGTKGRVARKMGNIKDSTSVLAIQNYVEDRGAKVPCKELKIDRCMEYGQSRLIDGDHVAEVKEDLLANPPRWPTAASSLGLQRYGIVATQCDQRNWLRGLPCVMCHAVVFSGSPVGDWRPTRRCGM